MELVRKEMGEEELLLTVVERLVTLMEGEVVERDRVVRNMTVEGVMVVERVMVMVGVMVVVEEKVLEVVKDAIEGLAVEMEGAMVVGMEREGVMVGGIERVGGVGEMEEVEEGVSVGVAAVDEEGAVQVEVEEVMKVREEKEGETKGSILRCTMLMLGVYVTK